MSCQKPGDYQCDWPHCECAVDDDIDDDIPPEPDYNAEESRYLDRQNARTINRKVG